MVSLFLLPGLFSQILEEGTGLPGAEMTGGWELPEVSVGNWNWVFCKSEKLYSQNLCGKSQDKWNCVSSQLNNRSVFEIKLNKTKTGVKNTIVKGILDSWRMKTYFESLYITVIHSLGYHRQWVPKSFYTWAILFCVSVNRAFAKIMF